MRPAHRYAMTRALALVLSSIPFANVFTAQAQANVPLNDATTPDLPLLPPFLPFPLLPPLPPLPDPIEPDAPQDPPTEPDPEPDTGW